MPRAPVMTGLWLLGLIVAYLVGRITVPPAESGTGSTGKTGSPVSGQDYSPGQALHLASARAFPQAAIKLQTHDEFQSAFQELLPSLSDGRTHDALFMLADVWASKDPAAATTWLANLDLGDPRNPYLFSAFSKWASQDPLVAKAWFDSNPQPEGESRDYMLACLIRGLAVSEPDAALKILLESPASPERTGSLDFLIRAWTGVGLEHAFKQVAALPESSGALKTQAIKKLTTILTVDELDTARAWADGLSSFRERDAARTGIAARWSQTDPVSAATWAEGMSQPETKSKALGEVGIRWARIDPLAASAWLADRDANPEVDLAARAIAWSTVGIDPDTAFNQVADITHESLRDETFEQIGRFWLSREPQAAKIFLQRESPMPSAIRETLLESFE